MKKCPYCAEEIQEEAIKCKHCGEWLNKKVDFKKTLLRAKQLVEEKKENYVNKKYKHLYVPTEANPLIIDKIAMFPDRLVFENKTIHFDEIATIDFHASKTSFNGFTSSNDIDFSLGLFNDRGRVTIIKSSRDKEALIKWTASKKIKEQLVFIKPIIEKLTFEQRHSKYQKELEVKGYFTYRERFKIFKNGDIYKDDVKRGNLKIANENKLLVWGTKWGGWKSSSFDPYDFVIYAHQGVKVKIAGMDLSNKLSIWTIEDIDVLKILIDEILEN